MQLNLNPSRREYRRSALLLCWLSTLLALSFANVPEGHGASAVAVGVDPKTGEQQFGYWTGSKLTEREVQKRAIGVCLLAGCRTAKIIASTPQRGCGAVASYRGGGEGAKFVAILAKLTQRQAISAVVREAQLRGGRSGAVVAAWCDL